MASHNKTPKSKTSKSKTPKSKTPKSKTPKSKTSKSKTPKSKTSKSETTSNEKGYCVKCKEKRTMKDTKKVQTKNGRNALSGVCENCGTKMMKFVK
jgi:hypothetical protein